MFFPLLWLGTALLAFLAWINTKLILEDLAEIRQLLRGEVVDPAGAVRQGGAQEQEGLAGRSKAGEN
ncbi:MAG: hypothetical protein GX062_05930 [Firmicutes bacterium]|jgi:hypothetical protein|nr:hypothetical protein [Bacillota bacterium]